MSKNGKDRDFQSVNYTMYYATACDSINRIRENNRFFEKDDISLDDENSVRGIIYDNERLAVTTIVFCSMTLESYINHYGSTNLSKTYFDKYLDKLDLKAKWIIVPRLITGKQVNPGCKAFAQFSNLITLRNKLVHDKAKVKKESLPEEKDSLWDSDAEESLECVKLMIAELKLIDNSIYSDWIL
jgi:hypothetical protein